MTIGEKIKWARNERGWTIRELERQASLPEYTNLKAIEAGWFSASSAELAKIADALKRDFNWFLSDDEPKQEIFVR